MGATASARFGPCRRAPWLALWLLAPALQAADPQPYRVTLTPIGQAELDQTFSDASTLLTLQDKAPVSPFALLARTRRDLERFGAALRSFGYYNGHAEASIGGQPLDAPDLLNRLKHLPADPPVEVAIRAETGPAFTLRRVELHGEAPEQAVAALALEEGTPIAAPQLVAAGLRMQEVLKRLGFALAKVEAPVVTLPEREPVFDVSYKVTTGPKTDVGAVVIQGLSAVDEAYIRTMLPFTPGEAFNPDKLDKARRDLVATGLFGTVRLEPAHQLDASGRLPLLLDVRERKAHAVNVNAAFSTDLGGNVTAGWLHRNLLGGGEQLNFTAGIQQIGGNSTKGIGYQVAASFLKPNFYHPDQSLRADLALLRENLLAYRRDALLGSISLTRRLSDRWSATLGLAGSQQRVAQQGTIRDYTLVSLPASLKYDSTDSLLEPTQGVRATLQIEPYASLASRRPRGFLLGQLAVSGYWDFDSKGRSILAARGTVGGVGGADTFDLPPDRRFYAGGSATVRGYRFQSIGPRFPDTRPQGGSLLAAASVEFRQRILDDYGAVAFIDAGQVGSSRDAFTNAWKIGVGVGARYYSPVGPIRVDFAVPVNPDRKSGSFEVYIGLGQAF